MVFVTKTVRLTFQVFAFMAILMQSIIPQGFMPDFEGKKLFALEICSESGLSTIYLPSSYGGSGIPKEGTDSHLLRKHCPFASVASYTLALPVVCLLSCFVEDEGRLSSFITIAAGIDNKPWGARAPPEILLNV